MRCWHVVVLGLAVAAVVSSQPSAPTLPPGYAGAEACMACHEDIASAFAKSPHHRLSVDAKRGWEGRACEACHGPGEKHAESGDPTLIRDPAKLAAAAADKICLTCHLNQPTQVEMCIRDRAIRWTPRSSFTRSTWGRSCPVSLARQPRPVFLMKWQAI